MAKIEVQSFFYDLFHCKDKILVTFDAWDKKYEDDERGSLVAGMREIPDAELVTLLTNIQRLASGYERIKQMIEDAEQSEVEESIEGEDDDEF